jgi:elongation factor Tu
VHRPKDIEAYITFLPTEDGGRASPMYSEYRPQFYYAGRDWDAVQTYPEVDMVHPGETVRAFLSFMSPQEHLGKVYTGMPFLIREGSRIVGYGSIIHILELEASAKRVRDAS